MNRQIVRELLRLFEGKLIPNSKGSFRWITSLHKCLDCVHLLQLSLYIILILKFHTVCIDRA